MLVLVGLGLTTERVARAGTDGCSGLGIKIDGEPSAPWRVVIERACLDIDERFTDPTAETHILPVERDLTITVTLADGRSTSRRVHLPEALRPTLEALIVLPPERRPSAPTAAVPPPSSPIPIAELPPDPSKASTLVAPEPKPSIELGGGVGGRLASHAYLSLAVDAFAQLHVGSWLLGTVFRWDFIGQKEAPLVSTFETETVGAGLLVAHRAPLGFGALDIGLTSRLALETQTYETSAGEQSLGATDVRLGPFARLAFGTGALRGLIGVDAELSPTRLRRTFRLDPILPPLPAWSLGMSAGLQWAAP